MTGVVVVGMHRSGTSAVTRVVNLLGLPLGRSDDLYRAGDNPDGHWESRSLCDLNDGLLRIFGGWDMAPPRLPARWTESRRAAEMWPAMQATFGSVYGAPDTWVWKDPRICLTLPLWRGILPEFCAVLVVRAPGPVAQSLYDRENGSYPLQYCRALWDWYNRSAVHALAGLPTVVVDFDALRQDPAAKIATLADGLTELGVALNGDPVAAGNSVKAASALPCTSEQPTTRRVEFGTGLAEVLRALPRVSASFVPPKLPPPPRRVTAILTAGRSRLRAREWYVDQTGAIPWQVPAPSSNDR